MCPKSGMAVCFRISTRMKIRSLHMCYITLSSLFTLCLTCKYPPIYSRYNLQAIKVHKREREMNFFFKSKSRSRVHENNHEQECKTGGAWRSITVWRKSPLLSCNGFTVIDSNGDLIFRVENYAGRPEEVTLMDGAGKPVLTICRRNVSNATHMDVYMGVGTGVRSRPVYLSLQSRLVRPFVGLKYRNRSLFKVR